MIQSALADLEHGFHVNSGEGTPKWKWKEKLEIEKAKLREHPLKNLQDFWEKPEDPLYFEGVWWLDSHKFKEATLYLIEEARQKGGFTIKELYDGSRTPEGERKLKLVMYLGPSSFQSLRI